MSLDAVTTATGVREVLNLPPAHAADLSAYASRGERRLKQLVGATVYATLLAQDDADEGDAAAYAGARFGASAYYLDRAKSAGSRGVVSVIQIGETSETLASAVEVQRMARALRDEGIRALKEASIYVRPTAVVCTRVDVDEDDD